MAPQQQAKRDEGIFTAGKPEWCEQPRTEPLEVMCLGLLRTGTTSLIEALHMLGYDKIYNTRTAFRRHQIPLCAHLLELKHTTPHHTIPLETFESLWADSPVISGSQVASFAAELIALYPRAKIILTVRASPETWLRSVERTAWAHDLSWLTWLAARLDPGIAAFALWTTSMWKWWFRGDLLAHGVRFYQEHNALVRRLGEGRVLVFDVRDGWAPLCKFLGKEVPEGVEFPHVNHERDFRVMLRRGRNEALLRLAKRVLLSAGTVGMVLGLVWRLRWRRLVGKSYGA